MSGVTDGCWGRPLLHAISAVDCPPTHLPIIFPLGQTKDGRGKIRGKKVEEVVELSRKWVEIENEAVESEKKHF